MSIESQLREKLRKIEALFAGAGTAGERLAAEAALERVRARLGELGGLKSTWAGAGCFGASRMVLTDNSSSTTRHVSSKRGWLAMALGGASTWSAVS
jgi:hypothetical protein